MATGDCSDDQARQRLEIHRATEHVLRECARIDAMPETSAIECMRKLRHVRELLGAVAIYSEAVVELLLVVAGVDALDGAAHARMRELLPGVASVTRRA